MQTDFNSINQVFSTIVNRRSVRNFSDKDVSAEDVDKILHAANLAPSAHNQQSWRFIVIRGDMKKQLAAFVSSCASDFPKPSSTLLRMASRSIISAPAVIAVANTAELIEHGTGLFSIDKDKAYDFFRTMEIQSSAAAVENMLLAATSLGIASVWLGILYLVKDDVLEFLGEKKGEFMAVIPIGYPDTLNKGPKKRSLEKIVKQLD
ncbi:MAG: nitroreductase [Lentisphaerae bacterium GWF2_45_14]|nr:MAG: nitroreductase [Lentisphaerae bacterium GWF2_45_14]